MEPRTIDAFTLDLLSNGVQRTIWKGEASSADIEAVREFGIEQRAANPDKGPILLVDARQAKGFSRAARGEMRRLGNDRPWDRIAVIGASFHVKVSIELILRAMNLVGLETSAVRFADSAEEIMPWLEHGS